MIRGVDFEIIDSHIHSLTANIYSNIGVNAVVEIRVRKVNILKWTWAVLEDQRIGFSGRSLEEMEEQLPSV